MRRRCLIIFFAWFVVSMVYYGLTFSGGNINASVYLLVFLSGLVEIPSYLLVCWTLKKWVTECSLSLVLVAVIILVFLFELLKITLMLQKWIMSFLNSLSGSCYFHHPCLLVLTHEVYFDLQEVGDKSLFNSCLVLVTVIILAFMFRLLEIAS